MKKEKKQKYPLVLNLPCIEVDEDTNLKVLPDACFLLGNGGIYRYNKNKLYSSIIKMDKFNSLVELKPGMSWNLPKLPFQILQETVTFFTEVYKEHSSESCVMLYYNFKTKKFKIGIPEQEVSATTIDYKDVPVYKGFDMIGSIHCHGSMSAFHSETDNDDEMDFDGLHITVGTINNPTFACRYITNGMQKKIDIKDCVVMPSLLMKGNETYMDKVSKKTYNFSKSQSNTITCNQQWWNKQNVHNHVKETLKQNVVTFYDCDTGIWDNEDIMLMRKKDRKAIKRWVERSVALGIDTTGIISERLVE